MEEKLSASAISHSAPVAFSLDELVIRELVITDAPRLGADTAADRKTWRTLQAAPDDDWISPR